MNKEYEHIKQIAEIFDGRDCMSEEVMFYVHGDKVIFSINCNDYFYWACADGEDIEIGDIPLLKQSIQDIKEAYPGAENVKELYSVSIGKMLFVCRKRKERPQGCCYPREEELWFLFDAAGSERETGVGNPYKPGERDKLIAQRNKKNNNLWQRLKRKLIWN